VTLLIAERKGIVSGGQIDKLCRDSLCENYGEEIASEYTTYSLMIPAWTGFNNALGDLRLRLCLAFGPQQSAGISDYYEVRGELGLLGLPAPNVTRTLSRLCAPRFAR